MLHSPRKSLIAAGRPSDGEALPGVERVTIADEFYGGSRRVSSTQKPREVVYGQSKRGNLRLGKERSVFRVRSAVFSGVGHVALLALSAAQRRRDAKIRKEVQSKTGRDFRLALFSG